MYYLCAFGVRPTDILARVDAEPPDMGSKLKSATIVGFIAQVKTVVFTPAYNTTREPRKETDALSHHAVHPHKRNHLNNQLSAGGFYFCFLTPMGAYSAKEVTMEIAEAFTLC